MVEAAKAAIRWANSEFGIEKVYGSVDFMNLGSIKVMERVVQETACREVKEGRTWLVWPTEKVMEGEERRLTQVWEWDV